MSDTAVATVGVKNEVLASVLIGGDLSKLETANFLSYYQKLCESLKLNPLTKPFEKLVLGGKTIFYATKNCTDQLRMIHHIQLEILKKEFERDLYIVTVRATLPNGRSDDEIGAVPIANLKGDSLANALMKTLTKAKRRATLSIVGLSMLDETELETLPRIERPASLTLDASPISTADMSEDHEVRQEVMRAITTLLQHHVPHANPKAYLSFIPNAALEVARPIFGVQKWSELKDKSVDELRAGYDDLLTALEPSETVEENQMDADEDVPDSPTPIPPTTDADGPFVETSPATAASTAAPATVAPPASIDAPLSTSPTLPTDDNLASDDEKARVRIYAESHALGQMLTNALAHYPKGIPQDRLEDIEENLKYRVAQQEKATKV